MVGIGIAGTIEPITNQVMDAPALNWKKLDLVSKLKLHFSFPILIENDVNCALIGENLMGFAHGFDPILYIAIGTGLGGAVMIGGQIIRGANNMAGEIGYQLDKTDYKNGKENLLGEFGVTEKKISGTALGNKFFSSEEFFKRLNDQDRIALEVFEEFSIDLSILISNVVCLLNPEKVFLGGSRT